MLDGDRFAGAEEEFGAVEMGAEFDAVVGDFAELGEAEDLEAAAVGEDGLVPVHEVVEAAEFLEDFEIRGGGRGGRCCRG